ncbi:flagellar motor switch protein FliN [Sneathiella sp. HT1-7]|nr:flagellar motor switch protein FliN [Sneathiella sp. HT1-7]MCC3306560.1 flagellar motor switch protein FliN [Sneathiella sp. HT1-7]
MAEDEELNLEDLNKTPATDSDVAVQDDATEGMPLEGIDADDDTEISRTASDLEAVFDIPVHVTAVLGKSRMRVSQLLKLGRGAVIELDRKVGEAIDIYVNNRLVARGEVVVVEDRLGVTMTEIIKADRR